MRAAAALGWDFGAPLTAARFYESVGSKSGSRVAETGGVLKPRSSALKSKGSVGARGNIGWVKLEKSPSLNTPGGFHLFTLIQTRFRDVCLYGILSRISLRFLITPP